MAQKRLADPETDDLEKYFTDVEYLRGLFADFVAAKELPKRILAIHGVGGVGKSSLLRMFRLYSKSIGVPIALTSAEEAKSAVDVLSNWSSDLKVDSITLGNFQKTLVHYKAIQAKVEDQAKKVQEARKKAAEKVGTAVAKAVIGAAISLIPGGTIVNALGGIGVDALVDWLSSFLTKPDIDLLIDPTKALSKDFLEDIAKAARKRRLVLMLDTFEQMSALNDWVCDIAKHLDENILLVITGREMINWDRQWDGWLAHTQVEELNPMTEDVMRDLARRYYATMVGGEPDPKQIEAIIAFARGLPMVLATSVRLWVKYGQKFDVEEHKAEVYGDVVKRLREGVSPELLPVLESAAIVRWFDQSILRAVTKMKNVSAAYEELRRFPFVKSGKEGLRLHDSVRDIMEESLKIDDPDRHKDLHERAAKYFEKKLIKNPGETVERLELEILYHRTRINEDEGTKIFQEKLEDAIRYRQVDRLRILLNDINTYPLEHENNKLWRKYYIGRFLYVTDQQLDAEKIFESIIASTSIESKLRAYALQDYGITLRGRRVGKTEILDKALSYFEQSLSQGVLDYKLALGFSELMGIYRDKGNWEKAYSYVEQAVKYYQKTDSLYDLANTYNRFRWYYIYRGDWRRAFDMQSKGLEIAKRLGDSRFLKHELSIPPAFIWTGRFEETEKSIREAIKFRTDLGLSWDIGNLSLATGLNDKFDEAISYATENLENQQRFSNYTLRGKAVGLGWLGIILLRKGEPAKGLEMLQESANIKQGMQDTSYLLETLIWLGIANEILHHWDEAIKYYEENLSEYGWTGRQYFKCGAYTGLIRVKHLQGKKDEISPLLLEAEQLAQLYEYNDHLASLRLTQGHIAWEQEPSKALKFYQHALIYALRYNRFLLDEVLSGRVQGTPLRPIVPFCLEHGEEGHKMLMTLQEWWKTGTNDIGTPRPDTISPIPENIPLLEAEKLAREREPGNGAKQKTVLEQLDAAIGRISNSRPNPDADKIN